jgi:hypothetical protein
MKLPNSNVRAALLVLVAWTLAAVPAAPIRQAVAEEAPSDFPAYERSENFAEQSVEGWTVRVHKSLLDEDRELGDRALEQVRSHLLQVKTRVPKQVLPRLQKVTIWLNVRPKGAAEYHPSRDWLAANSHNPAKAKCVEVGNVANYLRYSRDQQSILLHELAHAYHDQVLGFDETRIRERFEAAKEAGLYDSVLHVSGKVERHYALSNEKEFFAEMTEAFLAANDFFPFVRPELRRHDPETYDLLVEIWEKGEEAGDAASDHAADEASSVGSSR